MKLIIEDVMLSYVALLAPKAFDQGSEPVYSASLIIDPENPSLPKLKKAIEEAKQELAGRCNGKVPAKWWNPLRSADEEGKESAEYAGKLFINAKSRTRPGIVDKNCEKIMSDEEIYSGCRAAVQIKVFPFGDAKSANKGVSASIENVMVTDKGKRLGDERDSPEKAFQGFTSFQSEEEDFCS